MEPSDEGVFVVTEMKIDRAALAANLRGIRSLVGERAILVPVKANAYGHGAVEISRFLADEQLADYLGVASLGEGRELRDAGITLPILCFSPLFPAQLADAISLGLSLSVVDETTIHQAQDAAAELGKRATVHLVVDSGMRRIGCEPTDAVRLAELICAQPDLLFEGLSTHLPESDDLAGREFTTAELSMFVGLTRSVVEACVAQDATPPVYLHASNSGGILGHSMDGLTMVRPGIMVYGYYPADETPRTSELHQVASLTSRVSFVKQISAGETVGYGRTWQAPTDRWIATIAVGYGDGYSRLLSNRGRVLIGGRSYPIAGRVCMDQCMVDLGETNPGVSVGDLVTLLGRDGDEFIPTEEVAKLMGTIPYEVTSLIAPRVPRAFR